MPSYLCYWVWGKRERNARMADISIDMAEIMRVKVRRIQTVARLDYPLCLSLLLIFRCAVRRRIGRVGDAENVMLVMIWRRSKKSCSRYIRISVFIQNLKKIGFVYFSNSDVFYTTSSLIFQNFEYLENVNRLPRPHQTDLAWFAYLPYLEVHIRSLCAPICHEPMELEVQYLCNDRSLHSKRDHVTSNENQSPQYMGRVFIVSHSVPWVGRYSIGKLCLPIWRIPYEHFLYCNSPAAVGGPRQSSLPS